MTKRTNTPRLTAQGLYKSFGGEMALAGVDLEINEGEVHALLGPNGSGKSTLIGCLSGRLAPDTGTITVDGRQFDRFTPRSAFSAGIAVIYQHFSLISSLSVTDNIFLGSENTRFARITRRRERQQTQELFYQLGADVDVSAKVSNLDVGSRQLVEIAKAMRHRPRVLILDEPTAALSEAEANALGRNLARLKKSGLAILYITHLLGEVFDLADRVTVLRDGRAVLDRQIDTLERSEVIRTISPKGGIRALTRTGSSQKKRQTRLSLESFSSVGVGPIDLSIAEGEVVGLFGLLGSGRSEVLEGIYGIRGPTTGSVTVDGKPYVPRSAARALRRGIALVPADRASQGIFDTMSGLDNLLLPSFGKFARGIVRSPTKEREAFRRTATMLNLIPARPGAQGRTFSGGNQQKLVVGRWLTEKSNTNILLLDEPTQGIDVGARADMYDLIRNFAADGNRSALFTSSDPEEIQGLADRALILFHGKVIAELAGDEFSSRILLDLAHGA